MPDFMWTKDLKNLIKIISDLACVKGQRELAMSLQIISGGLARLQWALPCHSTGGSWGSVLPEMLFLPYLLLSIRLTQQREHRLWAGDNFFLLLDVRILSCYIRRV